MSNQGTGKTDTFLDDIEREFSRLRWLAFAGGFFFLPIFDRVTAAGHWSKVVFPSLVMSADLSAGNMPWWFTEMPEFQRRLQRAELSQLERVFRASTVGLFSAILGFVLLLAMLVYLVRTYPAGQHVTGIAVAYLLWFPAGRWMARRASAEIEKTDIRINAMISGLGTSPYT